MNKIKYTVRRKYKRRKSRKLNISRASQMVKSTMFTKNKTIKKQAAGANIPEPNLDTDEAKLDEKMKNHGMKEPDFVEPAQEQDNPNLINQLFKSKEGDFIGLLIKTQYNGRIGLTNDPPFNNCVDEKGALTKDIFIYNKLSTPTTIDKLNIETQIIYTAGNVSINNGGTNIIFEKLFRDDYPSTLNIKNNGSKLEGGKSRDFVKTNDTFVLKSNSSYNEYYRTCICYILGVPVNPPCGLLDLEGKQYILEPYIKQSSFNSFQMCLFDDKIRDRVVRQFDDLIKLLTRSNTYGDFKLDNILFDNNNAFVLTDFSAWGKTIVPITLIEWNVIADAEGGRGSAEKMKTFIFRLQSYMSENFNLCFCK